MYQKSWATCSLIYSSNQFSRTITSTHQRHTQKVNKTNLESLLIVFLISIYTLATRRKIGPTQVDLTSRTIPAIIIDFPEILFSVKFLKITEFSFWELLHRFIQDQCKVMSMSLCQVSISTCIFWKPYRWTSPYFLSVLCSCRLEQGLTSHQTHYRSYRGWVLWVKRPNQQCQSTEGREVLRTRLQSY